MVLSLRSARVKMRTQRTGDVVAHWRCEETGGTTVADAASLSALTSTSSGNIITGPYLGNVSGNRGRTWTTGPSTASGASTAGQRTALAGAWTVLHACQLTSTAAAQTMVAHGASGETEAVNLLLSFEVAAGGELLLRWEEGAGVDVLASSGLTVPTGEHVLLVARKRASATAGKWDVDFWVWTAAGVAQSTVTARNAPTGGGSGAWIVGAQPGGGAAMQGTTWEIQIAGVALSDEAVRLAWADAQRTWSQERLFTSREYVVHTRALIRDTSGAWKDLTDVYDVDFLNGWEDSDAVDDDGASARVTVRRRQDWLSLAPGVATSRPNAADPVGQLIDVGRRIKLEEAVMPHGSARELAGELHWNLVFDGYVRAVSDGGGEELTLDCTDRMRALQASWVQPDRSGSPAVDFSYAASPTAIETVLAQMLVDWEPTEGYAGGLDEVALYTPTSPAFLLDGQFSVPATSSVAQALTDLVDRTIAWLLRWTFDEVRQEFRLTLSDPGRSRTWGGSDLTITEESILAWRRIETSDEDIRNDVEVEYGDVADGDNLTVNKRKSVRVTDATSITRYWRRYCRIGLASSSELGTSGQATTLANAVLSDLSAPLADVEIDILPTRRHQLGDLLKITADGRRWSADTVFAVVGVRHSRSPDDRRTTLVLRGTKPVGRRRRWQDLIDQVGVTGGDGLTPPRTPAAPSLDRIDAGLVVRWPFPANAGNRRYDMTEIHLGSSAGFTPSSSTLVSIARGVNAASLALTPGTTKHVKVLHRDEMGTPSLPSPVASAAPRHRGSSLYAKATRTTGEVGLAAGENFIEMTTVSDPFSCLSNGGGGKCRFTAPVDGLYRCTLTARAAAASGLSESVRLFVKKNATTIVAIGPAPPEDESVDALLTTDIPLAAGDFIDWGINPVNKSADYPSGFKVGADGVLSSFIVQLVDES